MLVLSIPSSQLDRYGVSEDSTEEEWLKAVEQKLAKLKVGARSIGQTSLAVITGNIEQPGKLVAFTAIQVSLGGSLILIDPRRPDDEDELRRKIQEANLVVTRNPVQYLNAESPSNNCACGCGIKVWKDFASGHDQRALQARVQKYFGGSVLTAINELDRVFGTENKD